MPGFLESIVILINMLFNQSQIIAHATASYELDKQECCGLILKDGTIQVCDNKAADYNLDPSLNFAIGYRTNPNWSQVAAVYHSHTNGNGKFTPADVRSCKELGLPFVLYDVVHNRFSSIDPSGNADYLGRQFCYGVYDCYSLIRDYYRRELGIILDDFDRTELFTNGVLDWNTQGWTKIISNYAGQGFVEVDVYGNNLKVGDLLLMQIGNAESANHLGIFTDAVNQVFMHQLLNHPSKQEVFGHPWDMYTIKYLRHVSHC